MDQAILEARSSRHDDDESSQTCPYSASTPGPVGPVPIGEAINAATRPVHAKLNKLILLRLPHAIPALADSPGSYASGLLHIAPIYATFEAEWQQALDPERDITPETRALLETLHVPGLERTERLKSDIRSLTGWSAQTVREQLDSISQTGHLSAFVQHIKDSIRARPAVLVAYSWVMYMALFSGGRFIRATLESAGEAFWKLTPGPIRPNLVPCEVTTDELDDTGEDGIPAFESDATAHFRLGARAATTPIDGRNGHRFPLAFFHFATPRDGEDLKAEFKQRLAAADAHLSEPERAAVVAEAQCIFNNLILITGQLDEVCATRLADPHSSLGLAELLNPKGRFRDSIAISKERACRMAMRREGVLEGCPEGEGSSSSASSSGSSDSSREFVGLVQKAVGEQLDEAEGNTAAALHWEAHLPAPERVDSTELPARHAGTAYGVRGPQEATDGPSDDSPTDPLDDLLGPLGPLAGPVLPGEYSYYVTAPGQGRTLSQADMAAEEDYFALLRRNGMLDPRIPISEGEQRGHDRYRAGWRRLGHAASEGLPVAQPSADQQGPYRRASFAERYGAGRTFGRPESTARAPAGNWDELEDYGGVNAADLHERFRPGWHAAPYLGSGYVAYFWSVGPYRFAWPRFCGWDFVQAWNVVMFWWYAFYLVGLFSAMWVF